MYMEQDRALTFKMIFSKPNKQQRIQLKYMYMYSITTNNHPNNQSFKDVCVILYLKDDDFDHLFNLLQLNSLSEDDSAL